MGLLDQVLGQVLAGAGGSGASRRSDSGAALVEGILDMLTRSGGVEGLARGFEQSGHGDEISSWISTGQNKPIAPDDLARTLGPERVDEWARRAGVPPQGGAGILAQLLPVLIDQLTPSGNAPRQDQLGQLGAELLRNLASAAKQPR